MSAKIFFTASLSVNSLCHLFHRQFPSLHISPVSNNSLRKRRVVLLHVDVGDQPMRYCCVPRDERKICDRHLVPDKILLLREHALQNAEHTLDLVVVPLDRARDLLRVELLEPRGLTEVWTVSPPQRHEIHHRTRYAPLTGNLEGEPLQLEVLVLAGTR